MGGLGERLLNRGDRLAVYMYGFPPTVTLLECSNCQAVLAKARSLKALPPTTYVHDCNRCLGKSEYALAELRRENRANHG